MFFPKSLFVVVPLAACVVDAATSFGTGTSIGPAKVVRVASSSIADHVLLNAGHDFGFRRGMVVSVYRDGEAIGELMLVELRPHSASALITLLSNHSIRPGDDVIVNTFSSR